MKNIFALFICMLIAFYGHALKPENKYINLPSDFGIPYKTEIVKTIDGYNLNSWVFDPYQIDSTTQTIVIANSDAGNMSYNISYAAYLQYRGFRVITFDYRGFGKSSLFKIDTSAFYYKEFETDLECIILHFSAKYKTKLNVLAFSLGTLVSLNVNSKDSSLVNKFVFDGLVSNPEELILRVQELKKQKVITYAFSHEINNLNKKNVLVFVGNKDKYTTLSDASQFQTINTNVEIVVYSGNHLESTIKLGNKYFDYITSFINN